MNKSNKKVPSKFAPIFIASTAIFFLGSAFKFIFNKDNATDRQHAKQQNSVQNYIEENSVLEEESEAHEPEEDPVQSL